MRTSEAKEATTRPRFALCLSGGGFRAVLFHLGMLKRVHELGLFQRIAHVAGVSGGSIVAAQLGLHWDAAISGDCAAFHKHIFDPLFRFCDKRIDVFAMLAGLLPFATAGVVLRRVYRGLYGDRTIGELPSGHAGTEFVLLATSVQTGRLFRFAASEVGDYMDRIASNPKVLVADAVTASSAFPPILSPVVVPIPGRRRTVLTDGGAYDNLGLEIARRKFDHLIVSDAGQRLVRQERPWHWLLPHSARTMLILDHQVRMLRYRWLIGKLMTSKRRGAYIQMQPTPRGGWLDDALPVRADIAEQLAATKTRLWRVPLETKKRLVNLGYAMADVRLRQWVVPDAAAPRAWPFPESPLGGDR